MGLSSATQSYSTAQLSRLVEDDVIESLAFIYPNGRSVFDLYTIIAGQPYGRQVTAGFFNKLISDMAATGVINKENLPRSETRVICLSQAEAQNLGLGKTSTNPSTEVSK